MLLWQELSRGLLSALVTGLMRSTLLTGLLLSAGLPTGLLPQLRLALSVARSLWRLLPLVLILPAGLRSLALNLILVLRSRRSASRYTLLNAGLLSTVVLRCLLVALLDPAMLVRTTLGQLLPTIQLVGWGGLGLLSSLLLSVSALLVRWLSAALLVISSAKLSDSALGTAVLLVHVVARLKVHGGAIKRRPPFTRMEPESTR